MQSLTNEVQPHFGARSSPAMRDPPMRICWALQTASSSSLQAICCCIPMHAICCWLPNLQVPRRTGDKYRIIGSCSVTPVIDCSTGTPPRFGVNGAGATANRQQIQQVGHARRHARRGGLAHRRSRHRHGALPLSHFDSTEWHEHGAAIAAEQQWRGILLRRPRICIQNPTLQVPDVNDKRYQPGPPAEGEEEAIREGSQVRDRSDLRVWEVRY